MNIFVTLEVLDVNEEPDGEPAALVAITNTPGLTTEMVIMLLRAAADNLEGE
jgi:hypothetical protein